MTFSSGLTRVSCLPSGLVTAVRHQSHPGSYLTGATLGTLRVDGVELEPQPPEVLADVDEVEFVHTYPDRLQVVVRHTFAAGWGVRIVCSSLAEQTQSVDRAELRLEPAPACVAWALPLGVTLSYSLLPISGAGPILGGVLLRGSVDAVTGQGLELSPFELRPGGRYVTQVQWDWYASTQAFTAERHRDLPSALVAVTGESIGIRVDEDVAVVVPPQVQGAEAPDHLDLVADEPGRHRVELRSARGTAALDLQWVDPLPEALARLVPAALAAPRTAAGVVKLTSVSAALVVQHLLALNQVDDPDVAVEALDLFTARLVSRATETPDAVPPPGAGGARILDPLEAAYLCREYDRSGDLDLLQVASRGLLTHRTPVPGLGLAATQLCLGLIVSGQPAAEVLGFLLRLAAGLHEPVPDDDPHPELDGSDDAPAQVSRLAAELELIAVTSAGPGAAGGLTARSDVVRRVAALGTQLGAGLRGRAVTPLPVAELSHLLTVLQLLPDGLSSELSRRWGCSAHSLAASAVPELLARLEGEPAGPAHAWLVLAMQTS